jgi:hypothetical protein
MYDLASLSTQAIVRPPRIILLGVEKIGKTTFGASFPSPVLISMNKEEGSDEFAVAKFPTCYSYQDTLSCLKSLATEDHNLQTAIIDSASTLEPLIWADICDKSNNAKTIDIACGGYGKGYTEALNYWNEVVNYLDYLRNNRGMATIVIGHVRVRVFNDPNGPAYDQYQFDIHEKASSLLLRWADCILFCNTKVISKDNDKHTRGIDITPGMRYLYTQKRPAHPGGGRGVFGKLPYELPLSYEAFSKAAYGQS